MSRLFLLDRFFHGMWLGRNQGLDLCLFSSSFNSLSKLHSLCFSFNLCTNGASGDTDDSAFVVLRDNHHVVTSRPMDSAIMEQAASLITQCQVWICACSPPPSIPCISVSICGAASSDCTSFMACGWVGIMVWICACSPPSSLPCPSSIPSVSVSICDISMDLKLDMLCISLFYCQQDLSVYFIGTNGASGDTDDFAFVMLRQPSCGNFKAYEFCNYGASCKFDHPVPVNPYHYAGLTMPSLPTAYGQPSCGNFKAYGFCNYGASCKFDHPVPVNPYHYAGLTMPSLPTALYSETIQHPNIRRTLITTNTTAMSRLFLLDRFFHGMWLVSICGAASSDCTSSMACGWGQPACANFKAYGLCKYGASCKFDHPVPVNPYQYAGFTMLYMPTAYAPPVSTQVRITSPPSLSDSTTVSNGDKSAAENKSSETEKQDEIAGLITKPL
uniref:C3H1-type domain-containing protein n=1 Tax=Brassica campestris TaxID=3711 RepID=M4CBU5_BRACM